MTAQAAVAVAAASTNTAGPTTNTYSGNYGSGSDTCAALTQGLTGNVGGAVSSLCGGGQVCNLIGGILNKSSIGQQINTFTSGIMNQVSGTINNAVSGFANSLSSSVSELFSSSGVSSALMSQIQSTSLSEGLSGIANMTIDTSGISSSLLSGIGNIPSIDAATGVVTDAAGSAVGAAAGLVAVPVNDVGTQTAVGSASSAITGNATGIGNTTNSHLAAIHADQDTQKQVTCVLLPMVQAAKKSILTQISQTAVQYANTGRDNGPIYYTGPAQDTQRYDYIANNFINNLAGTLINSAIAPQVQQNMATQYANSQEPSATAELRHPERGSV